MFRNGVIALVLGVMGLFTLVTGLVWVGIPSPAKLNWGDMQLVHVATYLLVAGLWGVLQPFVLGFLYDRNPRSTWPLWCICLALGLTASFLGGQMLHSPVWPAANWAMLVLWPGLSIAGSLFLVAAAGRDIVDLFGRSRAFKREFSSYRRM